MAFDDPSQGVYEHGWQLVKRVRNPWGRVPLTNGGAALPGRARDYMTRLAAQQGLQDPKSRRHHYVPKAYLRQWSRDGRQIWALDTATGVVNRLGIRDVCVSENFHRVVGPGGTAHNRVELLFGVVDTELRRVQTLFDKLEDPETLEFDDLVGLSVSVAVQRMRTSQQRRLQRQRDAWLAAQNPRGFPSIKDDAVNPHREASVHTQLIFDAMWEAADVLTTRQIEVWHDEQGRFLTCDAPVLVPFVRNVRPGLMAAPLVIWPISPHRVIALTNDPQGEKAVIRKASGKLVGMARRGVEQGRERMIFSSEEQRTRLRDGKTFRRRVQVRIRCSNNTPDGERIAPPGCCVEFREGFGVGPDVALCSGGLHVPAPDMWSHK